MVQQELLEKQDLQDQLVCLELMVRLVPQVCLELMVRLVPQVCLELMVRLVPQGQLVCLELME
jgi:hypothetical protein